MLLPQSAAFAALKNRLNSVSAIGYLHIPLPPTTSSASTTASTYSTPATSSGSYYPSSSAVTSSSTTSQAPQTSLRGQVAPGTQGVVSVAVPAFERANRLKPRDDSSTTNISGSTGTGTGTGVVKWAELLEKFRTAQDRARRAGRAQMLGMGIGMDGVHDTAGGAGHGENYQRGGTGVGSRSIGLAFAARPGSAGSVTKGTGSAAGATGRTTPVEGTTTAAGQAHGHRSKFSASQLGRFASGVGRRNTTGKK